MVKKSKARIDTPVHELGKKDTIEHYNAIMIEEMKSMMKVFMEGV